MKNEKLIRKVLTLNWSYEVLWNSAGAVFKAIGNSGNKFYDLLFILLFSPHSEPNFNWIELATLFI